MLIWKQSAGRHRLSLSPSPIRSLLCIIRSSSDGGNCVSRPPNRSRQNCSTHLLNPEVIRSNNPSLSPPSLQIQGLPVSPDPFVLHGPIPSLFLFLFFFLLLKATGERGKIRQRVDPSAPSRSVHTPFPDSCFNAHLPPTCLSWRHTILPNGKDSTKPSKA